MHTFLNLRNTVFLTQLTQHVAVLQLMEAPRDKVEKEGVKTNDDSATIHLRLHALLHNTFIFDDHLSLSHHFQSHVGVMITCHHTTYR